MSDFARINAVAAAACGIAPQRLEPAPDGYVVGEARLHNARVLYPTMRHDLESACDPVLIELEKQAAAHVRAIQTHAMRYMTAIRYADPVLAQTELDDVARRLLQAEQIVDKVAARLALDAPELKACPDCGSRMAQCRCEVPW